MFAKTFQATHPDMMTGATNEQLRDRYLVSGLFQTGKVTLNYAHNERFILGGAVPAGGAPTRTSTTLTCAPARRSNSASA